MITNYYSFLDFLFESYSVEQSKQRADEFMISIYKSKAIAEKKVNIKKTEINKEDLLISNEEWSEITQEISRLKSEKKQEELDSITDPKYLRVMEILNIINTESKLTTDEFNDVNEKAKNDKFYLRLQDITKDNPEMIDYFIRLFYRDYKNFNIELDTTKDDNDYDSVRNSLGSFLYYKDDDVIEWNQQNEFGGFGSVLTMFNQLDKVIQDKILNKFDKYKKMQEEQLRKSKADRVPGFDMMSNDIRDIKIESYTDMLLDRLPTGIIDNENPSKNVPNLLSEYRKLKDNDSLKIKIKQALSKLVTILLDNGVKFDSKRQEVKDINGNVVKDKSGNPVYTKIFPEVEKIFKMRKGTQSDPQEDKSLDDFITRVESKIQSLGNVGLEHFYNTIDEVNDKYGKEDGAKIVYVSDKESDKPIIVIQVKTAAANWFLHNNTNRRKIKVKDEETGETKEEFESGKLTPTGHCIAWPLPDITAGGQNRWSSYMKDTSTGTFNRKLYYVYNFELDVTNELFPFGVIIDEDGNITSAHRKDDIAIATEVPKIIKDWGLDFETIFSGLSSEEKEQRRKKTEAQKKIQQKNISADKFKEYLEYADPNIGGGIPLLNSVEEGSLEKVNLLAEYNANFNEPASILEKAISKIKLFETNNGIFDGIISKLLEIRYANIEGVRKNLGNNPIPTMSKYLSYNQNGQNQNKINYLVRKIKFDEYDKPEYKTSGRNVTQTSQLLNVVTNINDIAWLIAKGVRINKSTNEEHVFKIMFPDNSVDNNFIEKSRQILNAIPAKNALRQYDTSCPAIFEEALIWSSLEPKNFNYFKMVLDISKVRIDAGEDDFLESFSQKINSKIFFILPQFKTYFNEKIDEIYPED